MPAASDDDDGIVVERLSNDLFEDLSTGIWRAGLAHLRELSAVVLGPVVDQLGCCRRWRRSA